MGSKFPYLVVVVGVIAGIFIYFNQYKTQPAHQTSDKRVLSAHQEPTAAPTPTPVASGTKSLFVPSWSSFPDGETFDGYDRLIYFGVTVTKEGITKDDAYEKLKDFTAAAGSKPVWLTVKMIDTDANARILNATTSWDTIASDTVALVGDHHLKGVVLDLEMSAMASEGLVSRITDFVKKYHEVLHAKNIPLAIAIYGDVYYRKRPFNMVELGKTGDEIMIMAYDFHKSYGEPGPNFPLGGRDTYGYDFSTLLTNFTDQVPASKLTIIYGMYGYDWIVDEKKRPIKPAKAVTLNEVRKTFIQSCEKKNCLVRRDDVSAETEVDYIDEYTNYHIVWFEDEESAKRKAEAMGKKGIGSTAYWAYGYY